MATQEMKIKIGADVSQGVAGINAFNSALKGTPVAADKAIAALSRAKVGANQASNALSNLSRIAQDAPFGFIGISNNINPLLESFQRLKAETGSAGGALKALAGSLAGGGGLGLAVGIGTALLTVFGDRLFGVGKAAQEADDKTKELKKTIRDLNEVAGEGGASVAGDVATVNALAAAVADSNKPYIERKRALDELKETNKNYFGDLKLEDAATGKLTSTVQEYTKAIIASAIAKKFADEISNVAKAASDADIELAKANTALARSRTELSKANAAAATQVIGREGVAQTSAQREATDKLAEATSRQRKAGELVTDLLTQQSLLTDRLNKAEEESLKFKTLKTGSTKEETDLLGKQLAAIEKIRDAQKVITGKLFDADDINKSTSALANLEQKVGDLKLQIALRDAKKSKLPQAEVKQLIEAIRKDTQERINAAFQQEALLLEPKIAIKPSIVQRAEIPPNINDLISKATGFDKKIPEITIEQARLKILGFERGTFVNDIEKQIAELQKKLTNIPFELKVKLNTEAITDLSESLGESLAGLLNGEGVGNVLIGAAQSFLGVIGNVLTEVGKQIIATSVLIKALKKALAGAFTNPAAALGIGIALVSAGALLKNIKLPGFADGGIAKGPKSGYPVILHGEEMIIPMNKVQRANTSGLQSVGANIQMAPISISIPGQQLRILLDRVDRSNGRLF